VHLTGLRLLGPHLIENVKKERYGVGRKPRKESAPQTARPLPATSPQPPGAAPGRDAMR
jgi:hypothetical protein